MLGNLFAELAHARRDPGFSLTSCVRDLIALRRPPSCLGVSEYFDYRLYEQPDAAARRRFLGWRQLERLDARFNVKSWHVVCNDKLVMYRTFDWLGLRYPPLLGVVDASGRNVGPGWPLARTAEAAEALLAPCERVFLKPVKGGGGGGVRRLRRDAGGWRDHAGRAVSGASLLEEAERGPGLLLQEECGQHARLDAVCGGRLSGLRISVLLARDGRRLRPLVHRAVWKVAVGDAVTDNICLGASGNLVGAVDLERGTVLRVVGGSGRHTREYPEHPDTGERLVGLELPGFHAACAELLHVAPALPGLRLQHWDVALRPEGPAYFELNNNGDFYLAQMAERRGFLDETLVAAMG